MSKTERDDDLLSGRMASGLLDFIDTATADYLEDVTESVNLLQQFRALSTVIMTFAILAIPFSILFYVGKSIPPAGLVEIFIISGGVLIYFAYLWRKIKRIIPAMRDFSLGIYQLAGTYLESLMNLETVDPRTLDESALAAVLRRADPLLDRCLDNSPESLKLNFDVKGQSNKVHADVFVGIPWKNKLVATFYRSAYEYVWFAIRVRDQEVSLKVIMTLRKQLSDVLKSLHPKYATILILAEGGFAKEAIKFAEYDGNWIVHWRQNSANARFACLDLVKIEPDGSFSAVIFPSLEQVRQGRLESLTENTL